MATDSEYQPLPVTTSEYQRVPATASQYHWVPITISERQPLRFLFDINELRNTRSRQLRQEFEHAKCNLLARPINNLKGQQLATPVSTKRGDVTSTQNQPGISVNSTELRELLAASDPGVVLRLTRRRTISEAASLLRTLSNISFNAGDRDCGVAN